MVNRRQLLKISALGTASFAAPLAYSASNITMAYNTGNAIGSTSPKDLSDNARNLDHLVNGADASYLDRKGVPRKSWKGMESEFDFDQDNRELQFNNFMDASGYEPPIPYAPGILLDRTTKTVSYLGNEYRAKGSFIPMLTSNWATDESKLKLIGDDSLRQDMASIDALKGAKKVGIVAPDGSASTVLDELKSADKEYSRTAWSSLAGALQSGPLIVDATRYLRITGSRADAAYNDAAHQDILAGLPNGAEIEYPSRGLAFMLGDQIIDSAGVNMRGKNSSISYDQFAIQFTNTAKPAFNVKNSGLSASNLLLLGDVPGRALNSTQDIFDFDVALNSGHIDARIDNVGILYACAAFAITKSSGRNLAVRNCNISNCQYAFALEYDAAPNDQRMFEFYGNRYHTMGRLLSATDSLFYVKSTANALELIVSGGHADDSVRVMRGFAGMSEITALSSSRAAGAFADLDSTGFSLAGYRQFDIEACRLKNINATSHTFSAIKAVGPMSLTISDFASGGSGGHGIEIHSGDVDIRSTKINNASMGATGVYSGFYVAPEATDTVFGGGCSYKHNREVSAGGTTAKYGVENMGSNTMFLDRLVAVGLASGKAYYIDPTKSSRGPDPVLPTALQRISFGGNAAPTTGTWILGDFVENISGAGTNKGFRLTTPPLTFISV